MTVLKRNAKPSNAIFLVCVCVCVVLAQLKKAGDKDMDDIRTLMEEVDMRIAETKKDTYEFKRDIIIGAENPRSGKIVAEKMIK